RGCIELLRLSGTHSHCLNYIAHITRRIPQRFQRLRLANTVGRFNFQSIQSGALRFEGNRPLAERILAEVLAQLRVAPGPSAIFRKKDLPDSIPAIERDAAQGHFPPKSEFGAVSEARNKGANVVAGDWPGFLRCRAWLDARAGIVRNAISRIHPVTVEGLA